MDDIAATGAACWNCGETDAHFEEQGVRVAVSCYECGVRGAWAPTGEEALSSWHDIAETMALAEKAKQPSIESVIVCGDRIMAAGGDHATIDAAVGAVEAERAKAEESPMVGMIGGGTYTIIDPGEKPAEADYKIAEAARATFRSCGEREGGRCLGSNTFCGARVICRAVVESQNSLQKSLDTGKGEG